MSFDRRENTRTVPRSPADVDARYAVIIKTFLSGVAEDALRMRFKYEARRRCDAIEYFLRKNKTDVRLALKGHQEFMRLVFPPDKRSPDTDQWHLDLLCYVLRATNCLTGHEKRDLSFLSKCYKYYKNKELPLITKSDPQTSKTKCDWEMALQCVQRLVQNIDEEYLTQEIQYFMKQRTSEKNGLANSGSSQKKQGTSDNNKTRRKLPKIRPFSAPASRVPLSPAQYALNMRLPSVRSHQRYCSLQDVPGSRKGRETHKPRGLKQTASIGSINQETSLREIYLTKLVRRPQSAPACRPGSGTSLAKKRNSRSPRRNSNTLVRGQSQDTDDFGSRFTTDERRVQVINQNEMRETKTTPKRRFSRNRTERDGHSQKENQNQKETATVQELRDDTDNLRSKGDKCNTNTKDAQRTMHVSRNVLNKAKEKRKIKVDDLDWPSTAVLSPIVTCYNESVSTHALDRLHVLEDAIDSGDTVNTPKEVDVNQLNAQSNNNLELQADVQQLVNDVIVHEQIHRAAHNTRLLDKQFVDSLFLFLNRNHVTRKFLQTRTSESNHVWHVPDGTTCHFTLFLAFVFRHIEARDSLRVQYVVKKMLNKLQCSHCKMSTKNEDARTYHSDYTNKTVREKQNNVEEVKKSKSQRRSQSIPAKMRCDDSTCAGSSETRGRRRKRPPLLRPGTSSRESSLYGDSKTRRKLNSNSRSPRTSVSNDRIHAKTEKNREEDTQSLTLDIINNKRTGVAETIEDTNTTEVETESEDGDEQECWKCEQKQAALLASVNWANQDMCQLLVDYGVSYKAQHVLAAVNANDLTTLRRVVTKLQMSGSWDPFSLPVRQALQVARKHRMSRISDFLEQEGVQMPSPIPACMPCRIH